MNPISFQSISSLFVENFGYFRWWRPAKVLGFDHDRGPFVLGALDVFINQLRCDTDNVLTLPVLDHVQCLQRANYVTLRYTGHLTESTNVLFK